MNLLMYNMYIYLAIPTRPETGRPRRSVITARKRSLGQGNIFTPVCHSVHKGMCMVAPEGGCAWLLWGEGACVVALGGMCGFIWGACVVLFRGACMVLFGGACMVLFGGMHGFIWGGMHGFIWGACVVLFGGCAWFYSEGMHGFIRGGMHGFFSFFRYSEIRSMSGRYASYWNAFLFYTSFDRWRKRENTVN